VINTQLLANTAWLLPWSRHRRTCGTAQGKGRVLRRRWRAGRNCLSSNALCPRGGMPVEGMWRSTEMYTHADKALHDTHTHAYTSYPFCAIFRVRQCPHLTRQVFLVLVRQRVTHYHSGSAKQVFAHALVICVRVCVYMCMCEVHTSRMRHGDNIVVERPHAHTCTSYRMWHSNHTPGRTRRTHVRRQHCISAEAHRHLSCESRRRGTPASVQVQPAR
jgi:hypothetical protein